MEGIDYSVKEIAAFMTTDGDEQEPMPFCGGGRPGRPRTRQLGQRISSGGNYGAGGPLRDIPSRGGA
jgi:hypothetical protein